jgi:hypothetical protein
MCFKSILYKSKCANERGSKCCNTWNSFEFGGKHYSIHSKHGNLKNSAKFNKKIFSRKILRKYSLYTTWLDIHGSPQQRLSELSGVLRNLLQIEIYARKWNSTTKYIYNKWKIRKISPQKFAWNPITCVKTLQFPPTFRDVMARIVYRIYMFWPTDRRTHSFEHFIKQK